MRVLLTLAIAAAAEVIIFTQLDIFGIVPPLSAAALIWVSRELSAWGVVIAALFLAFFMESFRAAAYTPWFSVAYTAIAIFIVVWRGHMRRNSISRLYAVKTFTPMALAAAAALTLVTSAAAGGQWIRVLMEAVISAGLIIGLLAAAAMLEDFYDEAR